jgi:poly(A) polymerase Pap1
MRKPPEGLTVLKVEDWSNPKTFSRALKSNGRLWTMVTYSGDPQNLATLAGPEAQTTCFYRACAILQPNPPNTTMVQKFEKFLQSFNSLNPDLTKSIRDSLNQAKPLIANR